MLQGLCIDGFARWLAGVIVGQMSGEFIDQYLVVETPRISARVVDHAVLRDAHQPWHEWAFRIVGGARGMQGQKDFLDDVFAVHDRQEAEPALYPALKDRQNLLQKRRVGGSIAVLRI